MKEPSMKNRVQNLEFQKTTEQENQLVDFREHWPPCQHIVTRIFDFPKDFHSASPGQSQFQLQIPSYTFKKGFSFFKMLPCAGNLEFEKIPKRRREGSRQKLLLGNAKPPQVFQWKIHTILVKVNGHVLPEIRQLERRTDVIGICKEFLVPIPAEQQHKPSNRIRRVRTIPQNVMKSCVPAGRPTRFEGGQKA